MLGYYMAPVFQLVVLVPQVKQCQIGSSPIGDRVSKGCRYPSDNKEMVTVRQLHRVHQSKGL